MTRQGERWEQLRQARRALEAGDAEEAIRLSGLLLDGKDEEYAQQARALYFEAQKALGESPDTEGQGGGEEGRYVSAFEVEIVPQGSEDFEEHEGEKEGFESGSEGDAGDADADEEKHPATSGERERVGREEQRPGGLDVDEPAVADGEPNEEEAGEASAEPGADTAGPDLAARGTGGRLFEAKALRDEEEEGSELRPSGALESSRLDDSASSRVGGKAEVDSVVEVKPPAKARAAERMKDLGLPLPPPVPAKDSSADRSRSADRPEHIQSEEAEEEQAARREKALVLLKQSLTHVEQNDFESADESLRLALREDPDNSEIAEAREKLQAWRESDANSGRGAPWRVAAVVGVLALGLVVLFLVWGDRSSESPVRVVDSSSPSLPESLEGGSSREDSRERDKETGGRGADADDSSRLSEPGEAGSVTVPPVPSTTDEPRFEPDYLPESPDSGSEEGTTEILPPEQNPVPADSDKPREETTLAMGSLLIDAFPWGEVVRVEGPGGRSPIGSVEVTPFLLRELPPGTYRVEVRHLGSTCQRNVSVQAGRKVAMEPCQFGRVDFDALYRGGGP